MCDCGSQALAELQLSVTYSAKPLVLYRFTVLQLLVASCLTVVNFLVRIRSQLSCFFLTHLFSFAAWDNRGGP